MMIALLLAACNAQAPAQATQATATARPGSDITPLAAISNDPKYRGWNLEWLGAPEAGRASPLPAANRADGYNGGDLLRNGSHVLALRTTTHDRRAHLYLYQWDPSKHQAVPLKMAG